MLKMLAMKNAQVIALIGLVVVYLGFFAVSGCTAPEWSTEALQNQGFTDIKSGDMRLAFVVGVIAGFLLAGCRVPVSGKFDEPGVYVCSNGARSYRMNTEADTTIVWLGTSAPMVQFVDLDTGKTVRLIDGSGFECTLEK